MQFASWIRRLAIFEESFQYTTNVYRSKEKKSLFASQIYCRKYSHRRSIVPDFNGQTLLPHSLGVNKEKVLYKQMLFRALFESSDTRMK